MRKLSQNNIQYIRKITDTSFILTVHAKPGAKISKIRAGDCALEVALAARPVEGAANAELVVFLADLFGIKSRDVVLIAGDKCRNKTLKINNCSVEKAMLSIENQSS